VGDDIRHVGATEGIYQEYNGDNHQRRPQGPSRGLEQQQHAADTDYQIKGDRSAGTTRKLFVEQEKIGGAERAKDGEYPVLYRDVVPGRAAEGRISGEGQKKRKGQVNGSGFGIVEYPETQKERQRRGLPQLKQGPGEGNTEQDLPRNAEGVSCPGIGLGDHFRQFLV
jgi:hypothetical protein